MKAQALEWLLDPADPAVRALTLTDVLGRSPDDKEVRTAQRSIHEYWPVATLRRSQRGKGHWSPENNCYNPKFTSTVWQLMLLGELGAPRADWIESAIQRFMTQHQMENGAFACPRVGGRGRIDEEPCLTGNMLRTLVVFGYHEDPRVKRSLDWMPEAQFEDGGWNCDYPMFNPKHSSFMSTIEPLWAYSEIPRSRWSHRMKNSAERGAEFLLAHRLFKSHSDWREVELRGLAKFYKGNPVTKFHFPMYYYYDVLHALRVLTKLGYQDDPRLADGIHLLLSKMTPEGKWLLEGDWVRERTHDKRKTRVTIERLQEPSKWVTLQCYRVLAKTGELDVP